MKNGILTLICLTFIFTSCDFKGKMEKHDKAKKNADFIMENMINSDVSKMLPEKYFPKDQTEKLISDLRASCDWNNKRGKFVDFFTMYDNGKNSTAYIYEYFLKCDSVRFVLIYDMEPEEPELFKFSIEQIEQPSQMITDPSKQLLNQK